MGYRKKLGNLGWSFGFLVICGIFGKLFIFLNVLGFFVYKIRKWIKVNF